MLFVGWFGDRYHQRGICCAFNAILAIIGLAILGFASNGGVRYFGVFLATAGANANIPVAMTYQVRTLILQYTRKYIVVRCADMSSCRPTTSVASGSEPFAQQPWSASALSEVLSARLCSGLRMLRATFRVSAWQWDRRSLSASWLLR